MKLNPASQVEPDVTEEHRAIQRYFRVTAAAAAVMLSGGAIFYHFVEHLTWINSFYFCTITLTTVGYGDITPKTDVEKLFTMFYVLFGIGIIAVFANLLIRNAALRRELKRAKRRNS